MNTLNKANSELHAWLYINKLTQQGLAEKLGCHINTVSRSLRLDGPGWSMRNASMIEEITGIAAERLAPEHPKHEAQQ